MSNEPDGQRGEDKELTGMTVMIQFLEQQSGLTFCRVTGSGV